MAADTVGFVDAPAAASGFLAKNVAPKQVGANNDQKKEYIKVIFDDAFDNYGDGRSFATIEEWQEIKSNLLANKKDILTEQDIDILSKEIESELKLN